MANLELVSVIMAGGAGTRFWPLSTQESPKQFLRIMGDKSLLRMSFERILGLVDPKKVLVLTSEAYVEKVQKELPEVPKENIFGEPMRRDTAAAICLAALICKERFGNPVIAVLTSDHLIRPLDSFQKTLLSAAMAARDTGVLYTFGIPPTYPATGYGYMELGEKIKEEDGIDHFQVVRFTEKPDEKKAVEFLASGRFMWNSGMFVWTTEAILRELELHLPIHLELLSQAMKSFGTQEWPRELETAFAALEPISIDYGVMEKASTVRCAVGRFQWSDVGGWAALRDLLPKDGEGNAHRARIFCEESKENLVFCEDPEEIVALVGVENLVVVRSGKKTLICRLEKSEAVKKLVQRYVLELE
jgi:mannose-1-phosphate guanylyltransferase